MGSPFDEGQNKTIVVRRTPNTRSALATLNKLMKKKKKTHHDYVGKSKSQSTNLNKGHDFNCTFWCTAFGRRTRFIPLNGKRGKNKERARTSIYWMDVLLHSIISKTRNSCHSDCQQRIQRSKEWHFAALWLNVPVRRVGCGSTPLNTGLLLGL